MSIETTQQATVPAPVVVELSLAESVNAQHHGENRDQRRSYSDNYGIKRKKTHIRGLKGEFGFAKHYGLSVDLVVRLYGDDEDFVVLFDEDETTVDVKTTQYFDEPWLKVRPSYAKKADIYVLAAVEGRQVKLAGYATQEDVLDTSVTERTGHRDNHILKPHQLRKIPSPSRITALPTPDEQKTDED